MSTDPGARSVDFDTMGTLQNFIDSLDLSDDDKPSVIVIESIANSIDSKAKDMDLDLFKKAEGQYFFKVIDDGEGMGRKVFEENYHRFSSSSKTKGEGIGFAGVGAKLCFSLSKSTRVKTTTIGPDGPLCSIMWWNAADKKIKWDYVSSDAVDASDLVKLRKARRGTVYEVEIDYRTYNYLYNNYTNILRRWYNSILLGLYPGSISFKSKPVAPESFEIEDSSVQPIKAGDEKYECFFYILKEGLPKEREEMLGMDLVVYGKYIKTEHLDWGGRIKPEFEKRIYAIVKADKLASYLNFNKQNFKPGSKPYGALRREVEREFSAWLRTKGILRDEDEVIPPSKEMSKLNEVLATFLRKERFRGFDPFLKLVPRTVLVKSDGGGLMGTMSEGSQTTTGTVGGPGHGGGVKVGGESEGQSPTQDRGDVPMEERERKVRSFAIRGKEVKDDPREAWVDPVTQYVIVNEAHVFYLAAQRGRSETKWMQQLKAVVDALAYYKADEIFGNDYKKGSDLKKDLLTEVWQVLVS